MPAPKNPATGNAERDSRAARVRSLRDELNLSQTAFAEVLGLSRASSVSEMETGAAEVTPTMWKLLGYVEAYGTTPPTDASGDEATIRKAVAALTKVADRMRDASGTDTP